MTLHFLKTHPQFFAMIRSGSKNFEYRKDDCGFNVGDFLVLQEYLPSNEEYTRRYSGVRVQYILRDFVGLRKGYCVMSLDRSLTTFEIATIADAVRALPKSEGGES